MTFKEKLVDFCGTKMFINMEDTIGDIIKKTVSIIN